MHNNELHCILKKITLHYKIEIIKITVIFVRLSSKIGNAGFLNHLGISESYF